MGWFTGGGHGFLTSAHGMGADNLLEATIVTPDGTLLTANPCVNSDLFFATRGGGGSTFGVIISAVIRTIPSPQTTKQNWNLTLLDANRTSEFWDLMGFIHSEMPRLKAGGMSGYYAIAGPPYTPILGIQWNFTVYDQPNGTIEALMKPINDYLVNKSDLFQPGQELFYYDTYFDFVSSYQDEAVGSSVGAYGSHLLSTESLADPSQVSETFAKIGPSADPDTPSVRTARCSREQRTHSLILSNTGPICEFSHSRSYGRCF